MQATHTEVSTAVEVEDAEASGPLPVGSLEAHGIGSADVKKLRESGYHTIESVVYAPKKSFIGHQGNIRGKSRQDHIRGTKTGSDWIHNRH